MNAREIIESVENKLFTKPLLGTHSAKAAARCAILATLDAIREPSEAMLAAGSPYLTLTGTWRAMIDALKREIE